MSAHLKQYFRATLILQRKLTLLSTEDVEM